MRKERLGHWEVRVALRNYGQHNVQGRYAAHEKDVDVLGISHTVHLEILLRRQPRIAASCDVERGDGVNECVGADSASAKCEHFAVGDGVEAERREEDEGSDHPSASRRLFALNSK